MVKRTECIENVSNIGGYNSNYNSNYNKLRKCNLRWRAFVFSLLKKTQFTTRSATKCPPTALSVRPN